MIGTTLAHYRILERLGSGGMGEVWLAEDLRLGRPVALKVLEAKRREDEDERRRLLAEARMASKLNHPGIAVVYEAGEVESEAGPIGFLALEYVPGEPIDAWVARERPDLDRRLAVASEIAAALAHAHGLGIVHRDVKPSNVLVTRGGRIKILDFGLAVRHDAAAEARTSTLTDAPASDPRIGGTLGYMAPEQAMGYDVDARADAFAFGVVLYEMLAGEKPFRGATSWELVAAVLHREAPPLVLSDGDPRGPALARIVERLLAKEPVARWGDLVAVGAELDRLRTRGATASESPPAGTAESGLAVAAFENLTGEAEDAWIGAGLRETVASDLERLAGIALAARERVEEASRRLRGTEPAAGESFDVRLARAVGARFVVGGAVQRMDDAVRVTTRFFDARAGFTETFRFDGSLAELFALQDRVVGELARRLSLAAAANGGAAKKPSAEAAEAADETSVVEAFEALSRGLLNLRTETAEGVQRAVLFFERAVALDPRYARAHLELGVALGLQGDYLAMDTLRERALASLSVARRLRPGWTRAEREFGSLLVSLQRDEEAIAILERALDAAPDDGTLSASLARAFFLGRADFAGAAS